MISMHLVDFYTIAHACIMKKVIIFGSGAKAESFIEKIRLFGIEPAYCIDFCYGVKKECAGLKVLGYYEILKETVDIYILLTELKGKNEQACALQELGYEYLKDFNFMSGAYRQGKLDATNPVDPILGWGTSSVETNIDGAKLYGDINSARYKIAIMGGSVAESCYYDWKTWPEILYEKLTQRGENVVIISGGVIGYTSSKVLLKFVRDILSYEPDVLIDYNAILNDAAYGLTNDTPFIVGYQKKMMSNLCQNIDDIYMEQLVKEVSFGNQHSKMVAKVLSNNIRTLKAICTEFNIHYLCILHPSIYTKRLTSNEEKELFQMCEKWHMDNCLKIYEELEKEISLHHMEEYIVDGRKWTDGYKNIYYDYCHMYEEGNAIIADKILKIIERII